MVCLVKNRRRNESVSIWTKQETILEVFSKIEQHRSIARSRLEHHDPLFLENVSLGDACTTKTFPHELDTSPLCTRVHVARAKTRSCSSPRCDELGCSARYSAFLLSRPFQYLTVRPRGRPFSTCFLLSLLPPPCPSSPLHAELRDASSLCPTPSLCPSAPEARTLAVLRSRLHFDSCRDDRTP